MHPCCSELSWAESLGRHLAPGMSSLPVHALLLVFVACGPFHAALPEGDVGIISLPQVGSGT